MKRPVIIASAAFALACLLASALALASNSASTRSSDSVARRFLKKVTAVAGTLMNPAQQQTTSHNSTLNRPRVSMVENGRIVVAMESSGDIRGDMTLILDTNSDGTVSGGTWALVSSYVEDIGSPPPNGDEDSEGERFVNDGTLSGNILSGSVSFHPDGSVASMSAIQLEVKGGSMTFSNVSQGNGLVSADLSDATAATGSLQLNF